ncbi:hypothetical protein TTRE_0000370101 [Trichuris trichiura]|uniref:HIRA-interacting protein 3 n=1 Tax=Trichuris trichiura TaxID=36087 RepID=A0A077Z6I1_TRITR|nr:hypothetical protein TTRE_0000370101 [Trichuris trichiura]
MLDRYLQTSLRLKRRWPIWKDLFRTANPPPNWSWKSTLLTVVCLAVQLFTFVWCFELWYFANAQTCNLSSLQKSTNPDMFNAVWSFGYRKNKEIKINELKLLDDANSNKKWRQPKQNRSQQTSVSSILTCEANKFLLLVPNFSICEFFMAERAEKKAFKRFRSPSLSSSSSDLGDETPKKPSARPNRNGRKFEKKREAKLAQSTDTALAESRNNSSEKLALESSPSGTPYASSDNQDSSEKQAEHGNVTDSESDTRSEAVGLTNRKERKVQAAAASSSAESDEPSDDLEEQEGSEEAEKSDSNQSQEEKEETKNAHKEAHSDSSSLTSLEDKTPIKRRRQRKRAKLDDEQAKSGTVENARLTKLKRYARTAGLRPIYKKMFADCATDKQRIQALKNYLEENGLTGKLTLELCKKIAKKRAIEKEVRELDAANIIPEKRRTRAGTTSQAPERSPIPSTASKTWMERVGLQSDLFSDSD